MAVIAIDFDNTLVHGAEAIEGAKKAVNLFREYGHKVVINSCNELDWIKKTLDNHDIRYDKIYANGSSKPLADLYVDDKAYRFAGWDGNEVERMLSLVNGMDNRKWS